MLVTSRTRSGAFWRHHGGELGSAPQLPHSHERLGEGVREYTADAFSLLPVGDEASCCRSVGRMLVTSRTRSGAFWRLN